MKATVKFLLIATLVNISSLDAMKRDGERLEQRTSKKRCNSPSSILLIASTGVHFFIPKNVAERSTTIKKFLNDTRKTEISVDAPPVILEIIISYLINKNIDDTKAKITTLNQQMVSELMRASLFFDLEGITNLCKKSQNKRKNTELNEASSNEESFLPSQKRFRKMCDFEQKEWNKEYKKMKLESFTGEGKSIERDDAEEKCLTALCAQLLNFTIEETAETANTTITTTTSSSASTVPTFEEQLQIRNQRQQAKFEAAKEQERFKLDSEK